MALLKPSQGSSQIATINRESLMLALRAPTPLEAFRDHPTIAQMVKSLGKRDVLIQMTGAITKAFIEFFSPDQRMDESVHASFAESIIDEFPHESPADVVLFIKNAARGKYGETREVKDDEGFVVRRDVVNKGKTFGKLSTTLAMDWFRQYMDEKAAEVEKARSKELKSANSGVAHERVWDFVKKVRAETSDAERAVEMDTGKRVARLVRLLPHMGDERLRLEWKRAKTKRERIVVLEEANRRGLVQKRIEEHLSQLETKKP